MSSDDTLVAEEREDEVFDNAELEETDSLIIENNLDELESNTVVPPVMPSIDSPEWSDYVIRQLEETELTNGKPKCDGLRRIAQKLLGPIVDVTVKDHETPSSQNHGVATVVMSIKILINANWHPLFGQVIHMEDISNCGKYNTDAPYHLHQSATAATKAEGRIFRKLLRLHNIITAEESVDKPQSDYDDVWHPSSPIDEEQINLMDLLCKRLNLNVTEFINTGAGTYGRIEEVPYPIAQNMLQFLNKIQQKKVNAPKVGPYQSNWRNN